jgi:hypothetical protein
LDLEASEIPLVCSFSISLAKARTVSVETAAAVALASRLDFVEGAAPPPGVHPTAKVSRIATENAAGHLS